MKILFTYMGVESLGVEYLAAEAREAGHQVELAFDPAVFGGHLMWDIPPVAKLFDKRPRILKTVLDNKPDVVAFSCVSTSYIWSLELARDIKKFAPEVKTIFGGVHVTAVPERVIREAAVDCLIVAEADISFPLVLNDWEEGRYEPRPGVWLKRNGEISHADGCMQVENLDLLPFPAKDLYYSKAPILEENYNVMTTRGCPYKCTYCHNSSAGVLMASANRVRQRSVDNLIAELEVVVGRGRARLIKFFDDVFALRKDWIMEFSGKYREKVKLPYSCFSHPSAINTDVADCLKESGCKYVNIGVQSVDEGQRRNMMKRYYSNDDVRRSVGLLKERGISVLLDHIIGVPGDTLEMMHEAAVFYNELRPDRLLTFWLVCFPGTEILNMAIESGVLTEEDRRRIEEGRVDRLYEGCGERRSSLFMRFIVLFSMIPILPPKWVEIILRKKLYRFLPSSSYWSNFAIVFNAVKARDMFFIHNIRYLLSRKKTP
jgi:anaerobic magnesium-protoporphyrin IX monomethyl ester cyclase